MSADNYIFIDLKKKPIEVWNCVASETIKSYKTKSLNGQKVSLIGKTKNLNEALEIVEEYEKDLWTVGSYLEYGIFFKLWCK